MGNIDSRAKHAAGHIYVKTDKPFYYPSNTVVGKIYIRPDFPMNAKYMHIRVRGKEKCSYLEHQ